METFIPCAGAVSVIAIFFGFLAFIRYMQYKETLALAEKGLTRPVKSPKNLLRWGIVVTALGVAFTLGLYLMGFNSAIVYPLRLGPWMLGGFVPLFLGLGLILIHVLASKE